jgi:hypothetical protein
VHGRELGTSPSACKGSPMSADPNLAVRRPAAVIGERGIGSTPLSTLGVLTLRGVSRSRARSAERLSVIPSL